jgi:hypothetical protein
MNKEKQRKAKRIQRIGILLMVISIMLLCYLSRPYLHETDRYPLRQDVYSSTEVSP